jgi:pre-mRNA cleavage complex 2 protein Pcf11
MAKTEERGWYVPDVVWTGEATITQATTTFGGDPTRQGTGSSEDEADPSTFTVPADESRDRCVVCGINFRMFFDNDDGIYKYSNCRDIEVLNDDVAEEESDQALVHVTCWRGLGSPSFLSMDQALQEARH